MRTDQPVDHRSCRPRLASSNRRPPRRWSPGRPWRSLRARSDAGGAAGRRNAPRGQQSRSRPRPDAPDRTSAQTRSGRGYQHRHRREARPQRNQHVGDPRRPAHQRSAAGTAPCRPAARQPKLRTITLLDRPKRHDQNQPTTSSSSRNSAIAATPDVPVSDGSGAPIRNTLASIAAGQTCDDVLFSPTGCSFRSAIDGLEQPRFSKQDGHLRRLTRGSGHHYSRIRV